MKFGLVSSNDSLLTDEPNRSDGSNCQDVTDESLETHEPGRSLIDGTIG